VAPDHKMESFIRSKYESRRWAMEGPRPEDPSVLEQAEGGEVEQVETRVRLVILWHCITLMSVLGRFPSCDSTGPSI
jgi:hypothetical protein